MARIDPFVRGSPAKGRGGTYQGNYKCLCVKHKLFDGPRENRPFLDEICLISGGQELLGPASYVVGQKLRF
jgi:hypothetical protein